jgi:hypothetical protein
MGENTLKQEITSNLIQVYAINSYKQLVMKRNENNKFDEYYNRQDFILVCISSFCALEAAINTFRYQLIKDLNKNNTHKTTRMANILNEEYWKKLSIEEKYIGLPALIRRKGFNTKSNLFKMFKEFIKFRNILIHSMPQETELEYEFDQEGKGTIIKFVNKNPKLFPLTSFSNSLYQLTNQMLKKPLKYPFS